MVLNISATGRNWRNIRYVDEDGFLSDVRSIESGQSAVARGIADDSRIGPIVGVEAGVHVHHDAGDQAGVGTAVRAVTVGIADIDDLMNRVVGLRRNQIFVDAEILQTNHLARLVESPCQARSR